MIIYNCSVSQNSKQSQQGLSSIFLMGHIPTKKFQEIQNWGWEFLKVSEIGIKQISKQRV